MGEVAAPGRLPITGSETVLDAINFAGGLSQKGSKPKIRLVRPAVPGVSGPQVLPVDYAAIVYEGDPATNYRLRPGDRVIVLRDEQADAEREKAEMLAAATLRDAQPKAERGVLEPIPSQVDTRSLERRLEAVERRLDRVIELLGGSQSMPPKSR